MQAGLELSGRYALEELLGSGGMGEVWRAVDRQLDRPVAVKVLRDRYADPGVVRRFQQEARISARLQHSGIAVVHDAGEHDGQLFIVMELLRGEDLAAMLERAPAGLPLATAVSVATQAAEALAAAHAGGVIHRDLKPANLFLLPGGQLKICDFGIARTTDASTGLTGTGTFIGTPAYMSPEQWVDGKSVDKRSDLYSLGCVLYALLVGQPPFHSGELPTLIYSHLNTTPASVRTIRPEVPARLDRLVCELLAKKPADRPSDAGEVAAVLRSIGDELSARTQDTRPYLRTLTGEHGNQSTQDTRPARPDASRGVTRPSHRRRPRLLAIWAGGGVLAVAGAISGIVLATSPPSHPDAGIPRAPSYGLVRSLANPGNGKYSVRFVAFSPDGQTLATPGSDGRTYLWDPATGHQKAMLTDTGTGSNGIAAVAFSPDSQMLATADSNGHTYLWDVATGHGITTLADPSTGVYGVRSVAFSPDGRLLVTSDSNGHAYLWDVATWHQIATLTDNGTGATGAAVTFSPDGKTLATADSNGHAYLWDVATRDYVATLTSADSGKYGLWAVAFSPDGKTLATADSNGRIHLWDVATEDQTAVLTDAQTGTDGIWAVTFSQDGKRLASGDSNGRTYLWDARTGHQLTILKDPSGVSVLGVAFSPDSQLLATADSNGHTYLWKVA
jgi:serine/threonine protein kinase/Tol biopolymer transport system component